jgi:replicative DNA helicase
MNEIDILESGLRPMAFWAAMGDERLEKWRTGVVDGRSTGFKTLDSHVMLLGGELTLIAARPSMGKTSLAMQIAENVARKLHGEGDGGAITIFSAEMSGIDLFIRMACAHAGVSMDAARRGKATPAEYTELQTTAKTLRSLPIWIDDASGPTTASMLAQLSELQLTIPPRMMIFDFVELGGDLAQREDIRIGNILRNLKGIAKKLSIPVLALSQLSREVESRANKIPILSDLRYSGMAEQIADKVIFIMRPEYYIKRQMQCDVPVTDHKGIAYVMVAKNRNGPVGQLKMAFLEERMKFGDLVMGLNPA